MEMNSEPVRIHLLGTSFSIKTTEDPRYFQELVHLVEQRFEKVRRTMGLSDPLRIAILSSIIITDELQRLINQTEEAGSLTQDLIELIDRSIE